MVAATSVVRPSRGADTGYAQHFAPANALSTPRCVMAVLVVWRRRSLHRSLPLGVGTMTWIDLCRAGFFAEGDAALVVELDDDHGALDAI